MTVRFTVYPLNLKEYTEPLYVHTYSYIIPASTNGDNDNTPDRDYEENYL